MIEMTKFIMPNADGAPTDYEIVDATARAGVAALTHEEGLIADVTTSQDLAEIVIDTDTNGEAFQLTDFLVQFRSPNPASSTSYLTASVYINHPHDGWRYMPTQEALSTSADYCTVYFSLRYGPAKMLCATAPRPHGGTANSFQPYIYLYVGGHITKFKFSQYNASSALIPSGSNIQIYGVRA